MSRERWAVWVLSGMSLRGFNPDEDERHAWIWESDEAEVRKRMRVQTPLGESLWADGKGRGKVVSGSCHTSKNDDDDAVKSGRLERSGKPVRCDKWCVVT